MEYYKCSMRFYDENVAPYLKEKSIKDPIIVSGVRARHFLDGATILTEPTGFNMVISTDSDDKELLGNLEKLTKGGELK